MIAHWRATAGATLFAFLLSYTSPVAAQTDCANDVADQQSVTGFSSLIDGQPTDPQRPTLALTAARSAGTSVLQAAIQLAPGKRRGLCDAVLSVQLPAVQWADRVVLAEAIGFGWEQRWHADDGRVPTIATFLTANIDYSRADPVATLAATLIVAKTINRVALYGNGFVIYQETPDRAATWTPGFVVGVKLPATAENALVVDFVVERGSPASVELAYQFTLPGDFDLGPGLAISLGRAPQLTVGLALQKEF